jgi:PAH dioxygenase large subunit
VGSTLDAVGRSLEQGLLPAKIFGDPAIFELEMERLFTRTWLYVGHESEIPEPGDYVLRSMAGESVLLVRGKDGKIRVLVNTCRHRGNVVCRAERGNAAAFQCPYHGWTYDNTGALVAAPGIEAYGETLDHLQWGLVHAHQVDQYNGLIFATFNSDAPSLDRYLGGARWYLDVSTRRSEIGLEVIGAPHRWTIPANWKLPADQFVGDTAHFPFTHVSAFGLGTWPKTEGPPWVANISLENGHGVWLRGVEAGYSVMNVRGYPESLMASIKRNLLPGQIEVLERSASFGGNIMPNLAFMDLAFSPEPGTPSIGYFSLRLWNPVSVDRTEIWSWCLIEKDTPPDFKDSAYKAYLRGFGPSGVFEQDDMIVWSGPTRTAKGPISRELLQNISMGMKNSQHDPTFPGPGTVSVNKSRFLEANARAFYRAWLQNLIGENVP